MLQCARSFSRWRAISQTCLAAHRRQSTRPQRRHQSDRSSDPSTRQDGPSSGPDNAQQSKDQVTSSSVETAQSVHDTTSTTASSETLAATSNGNEQTHASRNSQPTTGKKKQASDSASPNEQTKPRPTHNAAFSPANNNKKKQKKKPTLEAPSIEPISDQKTSTSSSTSAAADNKASAKPQPSSKGSGKPKTAKDESDGEEVSKKAAKKQKKVKKRKSGALIRRTKPKAETKKKKTTGSPSSATSRRVAAKRIARKTQRRRTDPADVPSVVHEARRISAADFTVQPLDVVQPPVPKLAHGLDRVLFNRGVYHLQDDHSLVYNFDPYLEKIMPVGEFDFGALKEYKTSSEDNALSTLAQARGKKYVGSTSSMTGVLAQFHYLLSNFRPINTDMLSSGFKVQGDLQTKIMRAPVSIYLRWQDGTYAIDADKEDDEPNILMLLGKSMEKLFTMPKADYERYRRTSPDLPSDAEDEAFQYTEMGDLLMRSQLDAYDPRLPGYGTFDLKTRCVKSIRHDLTSDEALGYELIHLRGQYESFESEFFDMMRATLIKYMLQVRMGCMDGIFLAYHNVERIFGFQYVPLKDIDYALHDQTTLDVGTAEFKMSLGMLNDVLNRATERFPKQSLKLMFFADGPVKDQDCVLRVFANPVTEEEIKASSLLAKERTAAFEQKIFGDGPDESRSIVEPALQSTDQTEEQSVGNSTEEQSDDDVAGIPTNTTADPPLNSDEEVKDMPSTDSDSSTSPAEAPATTTDHQGSDAAALTDTDTAAAATPDLPPLFAIDIKAKSYLNNVPYLRVPARALPELTAKWTVSYAVSEYGPEQLERSWKQHDRAKKIRKNALITFRKKGINEDGEEVAVDGFIRLLRSVAAKGRLYRRSRDLLVKDRPIQMLDP